MPSLKEARLAATILKIGNLLYAIQGISTKTALETIEVLDLENEKDGWRVIDQKVNFPFKNSPPHRIQGIFNIPN